MPGGLRNPFLHQVVADPWDPVDTDVLSINQKAFDQCLTLIHDVATGKRSTSLLMNGEAGSGKTHLMSRLRKHTAATQDVHFLSVRLETVASRIWRHIRRSVIADLLRRDASGVTVLTRILNRRDPATSIGTISYGLATILDHYRSGRYLNWCVAWLNGEPLPNTVLERLELAPMEPDDASAEDQSHSLILELCRLAAPDAVVLCFDQVEALETAPGDQEGLLAFGKAATALHAELDNALLISLIQTSFLPKLERGHSYILDRLSLHRAELQQLNREQATQVLLGRLNSDPGLVELRKQHPDEMLWPLKQKDIGALFQVDPRCSARKLLHHASRLFDAGMGALLQPVQSVPEFLEQQYASRVEASLSSAPSGTDSGTVLLAGLPILLALSGRDGRVAVEHKVIDFIVETAGAPIALCLINQSNPGAVGRRVKKINENWNAREYARLRLVRDARLALSTSAAVTQDALKSLRARGARLVRPSVEALASLDAIRSIYADAQSGHLANQGETVSSRAVLEWLAKRVPISLQELLGELVDAGVEDAPFSSNLLEYIQKQSIVRLEDAADAVGAPSEDVATYARSHPTRIGYLAGPPQVLFDPVPARTRSSGS